MMLSEILNLIQANPVESLIGFAGILAVACKVLN